MLGKEGVKSSSRIQNGERAMLIWDHVVMLTVDLKLPLRHCPFSLPSQPNAQMTEAMEESWKMRRKMTLKNMGHHHAQH